VLSQMTSPRSYVDATKGSVSSMPPAPPMGGVDGFALAARVAASQTASRKGDEESGHLEHAHTRCAKRERERERRERASRARAHEVPNPSTLHSKPQTLNPTL
jgi:hypothetical protein